MELGQTFDVIMITKNSRLPCLSDSLTSILREVEDMHRLVVVDDFSTDGTVELCHKLAPACEIIQAPTNRGQARQIGIEKADCDILFVDSDVVLNLGSMREIRRIAQANKDWGMIFGKSSPISQYNKDLDKALMSTGRSVMEERRGYTGDTLVRLSAVRDIKIPAQLHVLEDQFIREHIESKGYRYLVTKRPTHNHFPNIRDTAKERKQYAENSINLLSRRTIREILSGNIMETLVFPLLVIVTSKSVTAATFILLSSPVMNIVMPGVAGRFSRGKAQYFAN